MPLRMAGTAGMDAGERRSTSSGAELVQGQLWDGLLLAEQTDERSLAGGTWERASRRERATENASRKHRRPPPAALRVPDGPSAPREGAEHDERGAVAVAALAPTRPRENPEAPASEAG